MLGEGIVSFGVRVTTDFKNLKASTKMGLGRVTRLVIARSGRVKWTSPPLPWNVTGIVWPWLDQPPSWSRKSMCHDLRRCSPSVMPCSPTSSWSFTTSRMEVSSATASLSAPTRPTSFSSLSALSAAGRRRLPTWSARNGPRPAAVISSSAGRGRSASSPTRPWRWGAPTWPPTSPSVRSAPGDPWRSSTSPPSLFEVPAEEGQHLLPRVLGLRGTVALGVREVQERVASALVAVELVRLAVARQLGVDRVDVGGRGIRVVQPEEADHRRRDGLREVERRRPLAPGLHDVAAVEDAGRAPGRGPRPREQVGDAPAHAKAEHREVGDARVLERAQVRDRGVRVGEDLRVAQPPDARHHVGAVLGLAVIEIRRGRGVAVAREVVDALLDELVEAGAVHDHDDAGRLRGAGRALRVDSHQGLPFVSRVTSVIRLPSTPTEPANGSLPVPSRIRASVIRYVAIVAGSLTDRSASRRRGA